MMVGEMRDLESISFALTIAETGHLVLATMHTNDSVQTIDRIIDVFPAERRPQIQIQLAGTLLAVVYQRLLPKVGVRHGGGLRVDDRHSGGAQPDTGGQDPTVAQRPDHPSRRGHADPRRVAQRPRPGRHRSTTRPPSTPVCIPQDITVGGRRWSRCGCRPGRPLTWVSGPRARRRCPTRSWPGSSPAPEAGWWRPATSRGSPWLPSRRTC